MLVRERGVMWTGIDRECLVALVWVLQCVGHGRQVAVAVALESRREGWQRVVAGRP